MKDFDGWNEVKKKIDNKQSGFYPKKGSVYWAILGVNVGKEVDGKSEKFARPVLVVKSLNKYTCLIVPLTKTTKEHAFIKRLILKDEIQKINLNQLKVISTTKARCFCDCCR